MEALCASKLSEIGGTCIVVSKSLASELMATVATKVERTIGGTPIPGEIFVAKRAKEYLRQEQLKKKSGGYSEPLKDDCCLDYLRYALWELQYLFRGYDTMPLENLNTLQKEMISVRWNENKHLEFGASHYSPDNGYSPHQNLFMDLWIGSIHKQCGRISDAEQVLQHVAISPESVYKVTLLSYVLLKPQNLI